VGRKVPTFFHAEQKKVLRGKVWNAMVPEPGENVVNGVGIFQGQHGCNDAPRPGVHELLGCWSMACDISLKAQKVLWGRFVMERWEHLGKSDHQRQ
jgi:hypothetical protein